MKRVLVVALIAGLSAATVFVQYRELASILAETRLLLVPYAVVFVPGALFALRGSLPLRDPLRHAGQEQEAG